jgi:hypothetical protein
MEILLPCLLPIQDQQLITYNMKFSFKKFGIGLVWFIIASFICCYVMPKQDVNPYAIAFTAFVFGGFGGVAIRDSFVKR